MATERDVERLSEHFGSLSCTARHNRFMGRANDFARIARDCLTPARKADCFVLLAECRVHGRDIMIGEASYGFDPMSGCG